MSRSVRYVGWLQRRARVIFIASALVIAGALYLVAARLPLYADFAYLLPRDAPAVRDLEALSARRDAKDTMLLLLVAPDATTRAAAAAQATAGVRALGPDLVARVDADDATTRAFIGAHRELYVPLADLQAARAALARGIHAATLKANPLYIDFEDSAAPDPQLAELRAKRADADARLARSANISADGKTQVLVISTAFRVNDIERDRALQAQLDDLAGQIRAAHPGVQIGFTGGVTTCVAEQRALVRGVVLSSLITTLLVAFILYVHLRNLRLLALLTANIIAATLVAFGIAALTVGHLNAATAFLGAIIAGNGVNYGILLVARFVEERRRPGATASAALATAIAGTLKPTLVASLGAAIAYGALAATHFRGFADFAVIGGVGMLVCWVASFVLLPALMLRVVPAPRRAVSPLFGSAVLRAFGFRRPALVCVLAGAVMLGCALATYRYAAHDPFEYDMTQLRSSAADAVEARRWMRVSDAAFGRGLAGMAGQTFIAVDRADQIPVVVDALHGLAAREPTIGPVRSLLDVVPADQAAKLAVLADIRAQLERAGDALPTELRDLRPAADLREITAADLPPELAAKLTERDGRVGLMVSVRPGAQFDEWNGHDLIAFAAAVRQLRVAGEAHVATAGPSVLFADVITTIQGDGPRVTAVAALGLVLMVLVVVGPRRRGVAVLLATTAGSLGMIAACAAGGLKVNFLDFVALPITLGLGVDYAINVADRAAQGDPRIALRSTGGTVLVCSLTTMIGYTSLLVSDNLAIRGFGLASLIGEITCILAALIIVPAVMAVTPNRRAPSSRTTTAHAIAAAARASAYDSRQ